MTIRGLHCQQMEAVASLRKWNLKAARIALEEVKKTRKLFATLP